MTAAADVLEDIRRSGGRVVLIAPDRIQVWAPADLLPNLAARVRKLKPDLIDMPARRNSASPCGEPWDDEDWKAYFDERAAIREYDGGLTRPEAEELARRDVLDAMYKVYSGTWPHALAELGISWPVSERHFP